MNSLVINNIYEILTTSKGQNVFSSKRSSAEGLAWCELLFSDCKSENVC